MYPLENVVESFKDYILTPERVHVHTGFRTSPIVVPGSKQRQEYALARMKDLARDMGVPVVRRRRKILPSTTVDRLLVGLHTRY